MAKVYTSDGVARLDAAENARLWCAIRANDARKTAAALAAGACATGYARRGVSWTAAALECKAERALEVLLSHGADVWDEWGGRPLWAHTFQLDTPTCVHRVVFSDRRLCASSTHPSSPNLTPVAVLLWKRSGGRGKEGACVDANLDAAALSLAQRPAHWDEGLRIHAVGQAMRATGDCAAMRNWLRPLGCGLEDASLAVKKAIVGDAAHLAQWAAPEGEGAAERATQWLIHFTTMEDATFKDAALTALDTLLSTPLAGWGGGVARRAQLCATDLGRRLTVGLPSAQAGEGRRRL